MGRALQPALRLGELPKLRPRRWRGARYILKTDISQFYPSVYTHSIPWALHGKAIAWGMIAATAIGQEIGTCAEATAQRIRSAVMAYGPLPPVTARTEEIVARLASDKKAVAGAIHFVLPWTIGKTKIVNDVPMSVVKEAIETINGKI